jgi:hypothetical protein
MLTTMPTGFAPLPTPMPTGVLQPPIPPSGWKCRFGPGGPADFRPQKHAKREGEIDLIAGTSELTRDLAID